MARRRSRAGRAMAPGSASYQDPLRPARAAWVRAVVLVMLVALVLSVVGGFLSALG